MGEDCLSFDRRHAIAKYCIIKTAAKARGYATGAEIREMLDLAPMMGVDIRQHDFDGKGGCADSCFCKSEGVDAA